MPSRGEVLPLSFASSSDQEQQLLALTAAKPWDANLMLQLGHLQVAFLKYPEAAETLRRAIVLAPDNPRSWIEYASVLIHLHEGETLTDMAFHQAAKVGGAEPAILERVIEYFIKDEKPDVALHYLQNLLRANPAASPKVQKQYLTALHATGRTADAQATCRTLYNALSEAAEALPRPQKEQLLVRRALLLQAAGLFDDVGACLQDCVRRLAPVTPNFDAQPGILANSAARIQQLQRQLSGKDVFVFLPGPSATLFADDARRFADWDFVAATLAGYAEIIEESMLRPIGREVDLLWLSNPAQLRGGEESIFRVLSRGGGIRLLSVGYAFGGYARRAEIMRRFGDGMLWMNGADDPPLPSAPLEFLCGNSLSVFLPLLIWGQPARIFLFGADGGGLVSGAQSKPYFFAPEAPAVGDSERPALMKRLEKMPVNQQSFQDAQRRFRLEAKEADDIVAITAKILEVMFGLATPQIVNCCPHSAHTLFEKRTIDQIDVMNPKRSAASR